MKTLTEQIRNVTKDRVQGTVIEVVHFHPTAFSTTVSLSKTIKNKSRKNIQLILNIHTKKVAVSLAATEL